MILEIIDLIKNILKVVTEIRDEIQLIRDPMSHVTNEKKVDMFADAFINNDSEKLRGLQQAANKPKR